MSGPAIRHTLCWLFLAFSQFPWGVAHALAPKDLLDTNKLRSELNLTRAEQDSARQMVSEIRRVLEGFHWDFGRMTCEAAIWKGQRPTLTELKDRKKAAYTETENLFKGFRNGLEESQRLRLDRIMKGWEALLDLRIKDDLPFYYVDTRPVFRRMEDQRDVYRADFAAPPALDPARTYAQVLKTWTLRTYLAALAVEDAAAPPSIGENPELNVRESTTSVQGTVVRSPLIVAATLMAPDLVEAEVRMLHQFYNPEQQDLDVIRAAYRSDNRVGDAILIRLKMTTPYAASFLSLKNWIIYLEDDGGTGYEPIEASEESVHPLESIQISVPGRTYEIDDVLGTYYPYVPGEKSYLTEPTQTVTYGGHEAHIKLFFPICDAAGAPVISPKAEFVRLIIKPSNRDGNLAEVRWNFKKHR